MSAEKPYRKVLGPDGQFLSKLVATRSFKAGEKVGPIPHEAKVLEEPTYQTVQVGVARHISLTDDLVYTNHSCDPNLRWDMDGMVLWALRDIRVGDELTFFYPSSEWEMAQPFDCMCGSKNCLGRIRGAKHLDINLLRSRPDTARSRWIMELKEAQQKKN